MSYLKYKEITKYFNFYKELDCTSLPKYVTDYIYKDEEIFAAYTTKRDRGVFTNKRILLFDQQGRISNKYIHTIPYKSVSTATICFGLTSANLTIYLDSGYPFKLKFVNLKDADKTRLRILYTKMVEIVLKED